MASIPKPNTPEQRPDKPTNHARNAALLSIIPGAGQFYNNQKAKAIAFFIIIMSYFAVNYDLFFKGAGAGPGDRGGLWGLITLGEVAGPRNDLSLIHISEPTRRS